MRITAKKVMESGMNIMDVDNIWNYIDMYVEEERNNEPEDDFMESQWLFEVETKKIRNENEADKV